MNKFFKKQERLFIGITLTHSIKNWFIICLKNSYKVYYKHNEGAFVCFKISYID